VENRQSIVVVEVEKYFDVLAGNLMLISHVVCRFNQKLVKTPESFASYLEQKCHTIQFPIAGKAVWH